MEYTYVTFEVAKLAKEKGYKCIYGGGYNKETDKYASYRSKPTYPAPTQSLLQKWLREKHDIHIINRYIHDEGKNKYEFTVYDNVNKGWGIAEVYETYEEGLEDKLMEALKIIP